MRKTILSLTTLLVFVAACPHRPLVTDAPLADAPSPEKDPTKPVVIALKVPVTTQSKPSTPTEKPGAVTTDDRAPVSGVDHGRATSAEPLPTVREVATSSQPSEAGFSGSLGCPGVGEYGTADTEDEAKAKQICAAEFEVCCEVACKSAGYGRASDQPVGIISASEEDAHDLPKSSSSETYCGCYCEHESGVTIAAP